MYPASPLTVLLFNFDKARRIGDLTYYEHQGDLAGGFVRRCWLNEIANANLEVNQELGRV
jgi:hypothetical protein